MKHKQEEEQNLNYLELINKLMMEEYIPAKETGNEQKMKDALETIVGVFQDSKNGVFIWAMARKVINKFRLPNDDNDVVDIVADGISGPLNIKGTLKTKGLLYAIDTYNPNHKDQASFTTYAYKQIYYAMLDSETVAKYFPGKKSDLDLCRELSKIEFKFQQKYNHNPDEQDLHEYCKKEGKDYKKLKAACERLDIRSIDAQNENGTELEIPADITDDPENALIRKETRKERYRFFINNTLPILLGLEPLENGKLMSENLRLACIFYIFSRMKHNKIAKIMDITENNSTTLNSRATEALIKNGINTLVDYGIKEVIDYEEQARITKKHIN